jgi:hypothetical protein
VAEFGDIGTWAAAGIAVVAAGIAWWQTREARKSRIAAETQATEAAKSRAAAETQARSAEEQVALMRADRDERDAPEFTVSVIDAHPDEAGYFSAKIVLRMDRGQALQSLTVTTTGEYLEPNALHQFINDTGSLAAGPELTFPDVRPGSEITFYASAKKGYVGEPIALDLSCHERHGDRTWNRHYARIVDQRPQEPPVWGRFTPLR